MTLETIQTNISGSNMLCSIADMKVSATALNTAVVSAALSTTVEETILNKNKISRLETTVAELNESLDSQNAALNQTIKLSGAINVGDIELSGKLSVKNGADFERGIYIGNAAGTVCAPSANMMFMLGQNLSVFGTNSIAIGSNCVAGTNVLSVVDMYLADQPTLPENTIKLDSVDVFPQV